MSAESAKRVTLSPRNKVPTMQQRFRIGHLVRINKPGYAEHGLKAIITGVKVTDQGVTYIAPVWMGEHGSWTLEPVLERFLVSEDEYQEIRRMRNKPWDRE